MVENISSKNTAALSLEQLSAQIDKELTQLQAFKKTVQERGTTVTEAEIVPINEKTAALREEALRREKHAEERLGGKTPSTCEAAGENKLRPLWQKDLRENYDRSAFATAYDSLYHAKQAITKAQCAESLSPLATPQGPAPGNDVTRG